MSSAAIEGTPKSICYQGNVERPPLNQQDHIKEIPHPAIHGSGEKQRVATLQDSLCVSAMEQTGQKAVECNLASEPL